MFKKIQKKKQEKLKKELKAEIMKEMEAKQSEQKNTPSIANPVRVVHNSSSDLKDIQKKFLYIFVIAIFLGLGFCLFLAIGLRVKTTEKKPKVNLEEKIVDLYYEDIIDLENGIISNNKELNGMINYLLPTREEYYAYDISLMFNPSNEMISTKENYYMYFITKTSDFINLVNPNDDLTKIEVCDDYIKIKANDIDSISLKYFGLELVDYPDFVYVMYSNNNNFISYIEFKYSNEYYIGKCISTPQINFNKVAQPVFSNAIKEDNVLKISFVVPIFSNNKIYGDYGLTKVISDNPYEEIENYAKYADAYTFNYEYIKGVYVLKSISKGVKSQ